MLLPEKESVRVLVIEGHDLVRRRMLQRLRRRYPDVVVIGATSNPDEGLRQIEILHPDVVLIDSRLGGADMCRKIRSLHPSVLPLILTTYYDESERIAVCEAGAAGYFIKHIDADHLLRYIRETVEYQPECARHLTVVVDNARKDR